MDGEATKKCSAVTKESPSYSITLQQETSTAPAYAGRSITSGVCNSHNIVGGGLACAVLHPYSDAVRCRLDTVVVIIDMHMHVAHQAPLNPYHPAHQRCGATVTEGAGAWREISSCLSREGACHPAFERPTYGYSKIEPIGRHRTTHVLIYGETSE